MCSLLLSLSQELPRLLGEKWVGLYVYGSLFDPTFHPDTGDVDCIAVTEGSLTDPDLQMLRSWFEESGKEDPWIGRLQLSFLRKDALLEDDPEACLFQFGELRRGGSDGNPLIWMDLLQRGRMLMGPPPGEILPGITPTKFHAALEREVGYLRKELCDEGGGNWRDQLSYRVYAVLTLCRILYSLSNRMVTSKARAGEWMLKKHPIPWHDLVRAALRGGTSGSLDDLPVKQICELVEHTASAVQATPPGVPRLDGGESGRPLGVPKDLWLSRPGSNWALRWMFTPEAVTYQVTNPNGGDWFLKVASAGWSPSLEAEARRMEWGRRHLPVPRVVDFGSISQRQWLLTERIPGRNGVDPVLAQYPERLVRTLASGLWRFHQTPVSECPFDFRLDRALAHARQRLEAGVIRPEVDFHAEFAHFSAVEAVEWLETMRPKSESLVVCHGDYCPPNILVEGGIATGFVDLGELGVADRWWDLAVATWSVTWNFGPGLEDLFLDGYGIERDQARIEYFRLLYDVVS